MRSLLFVSCFFVAACGGDPEYVDLFEDATTVQECEAPTTMCLEYRAENIEECEGSEACEAQARADCRRSRAECIWRIERPEAAFPCPNQVCGEACTALDGSEKSCGFDFTCTDTPRCDQE